MVISLVGAAIGGGAFAFFSSEATSEANTFSAGTLTLALSDDDETDETTVSATWTATDFAPGQSVSGTLKLKNTGSVLADHVDISVVNTVTDAAFPPGDVATTPMDTVLEITELKYDANADGDFLDPGEDLLPLLADLNGNTIIDLDDLENTDAEGLEDLINLPLTDTGIDHELKMTVRFHPTLGVNQHQADEVTTVLTIVLDQDASQ